MGLKDAKVLADSVTVFLNSIDRDPLKWGMRGVQMLNDMETAVKNFWGRESEKKKD